jgi:hypothetical protein
VQSNTKGNNDNAESACLGGGLKKLNRRSESGLGEFKNGFLFVRRGTIGDPASAASPLEYKPHAPALVAQVHLLQDIEKPGFGA